MLSSWCDRGRCDDVVRRQFLLEGYQSSGHCGETQRMNPRQKVEEASDRKQDIVEDKIEVVESRMVSVEVDGCE
tara:strand:+ start:42 stop:263 length:222 start_codon:yes stop_codon:yes gene_type:complete